MVLKLSCSTCMTFDEVGAPARLSGGPSPATKIPILLMAIQSTFDLEPEEPRKRYEKKTRLQIYDECNNLRVATIQVKSRPSLCLSVTQSTVPPPLPPLSPPPLPPSLPLSPLPPSPLPPPPSPSPLPPPLMALEHLSQAPQFLGPFPSQCSIA